MHTTGLAGLDTVLHEIRPGDNIVFDINDVEEYARFIEPYAAEGGRLGKNIVYFRFAEHRPLLAPSGRVIVHELDPMIGFERTVSEMVKVIEETSKDSWYVFDCLTVLANAWYSDRMMANFHLVVCPFVLKLGALAYFALYKSRHSNHATETIYSTAQIIIEVYTHQGTIYIQPQRVENRHSPTMYMLHEWNQDRFDPVTNSAVTSDIVGHIGKPLLNFTIQRFGAWTQTYHDAQELLNAIERGERSYEEMEPYKEQLIKMVITRQPYFLGLAREYFDLPLLLDVMKRLIGSGLIGGKTRGILLAKRILQRVDPKWNGILEAHDSFFIGSDVFYTYIIQNDCWWLRRKTGSLEEILERAKEARERILKGKFLGYISEQIQEMLEYFGQSPIIVRSSSLQEDSYGNPFSGKYESVFCANQGPPAQRLEEFLTAVRTVYASSMSEEALLYRLHHGLLYEDEQMALLVQRVSGDIFGHFFFPPAAGVGFSYNPYVWDSSIDPEAGMLRLAFGLGTRAVDRIEDDYTRIVALNSPTRRPEKNPEDSKKFTQRDVDVVDFVRNRLATHHIRNVFPLLSESLLPYFAVKDDAMEARAAELNFPDVFPWRLNFDGLFTETDLAERMREMLRVLQDAYGTPVDIEFTVNFQRDGSYRINLVQCRPFKVRLMGTGDLGLVPDSIPPERLVMQSDGPIVGQSIATRIDRIIYVSPPAYTSLSEQDRYAVARLIGKITRLPIPGTDSVLMLVGPGRWGTSTPAMGVPVTVSEIKTVSVIVELAVMHEGLVPDVSLGTHFFNDLVELEMLYFAVFPEREGSEFNEKIFEGPGNRLAELLPEESRWADTVIVLDSPHDQSKPALYLHADSMSQFTVCYIR